ncbi:hypothetical protein RFI_17615 [Reticulomyxa filosa]|uniref:N-acetylglucosaminylphosphatidylinositol deacetylase n=1 Tax=Reticulomyxa filosa TaxID=46433 RepID=X6N006_RETFI|nr:hypothetical protein RFI_17615 [Reticulomyxa filosa]|eukprot:ETO19615.1 hypothetical protein RFI_17615 [Reticulomyxa filosa]
MWVEIILSIFLLFVFCYWFFHIPTLLTTCRHAELALKRGKVLLVIAHPDDESMFFSPILSYLMNLRDMNLSVLCLSQGETEELGKIRAKELEECLKHVYGLNVHTHLKIIDDKKNLPDNITIFWKSDVIIPYIQSMITIHGVDTIITFDDIGMLSSQSNLCVLKLKSQKTLWRKYTGCLEPFIQYLLHKYFFWQSDCVVVFNNIKNGWTGMSHHHSQFLWFRKLFVIFSQYCWMNTFFVEFTTSDHEK